MKNKLFFRDGLLKETPNGHVLAGNQCEKCGAVFFPKAEFCIYCLNEKLAEKELSTKGILYSYTVTRVPVGKFPIPHAVGMITLPEDKVRIVAPLVMDDGYIIGDEMEMVISPLWEEDEGVVMGYKFKRTGNTAGVRMRQ